MLEFKPHSKVHMYSFYHSNLSHFLHIKKKKKKVAFKNCIRWALVVLSNWCALRLPQVKNTCGNKTRDLTGLSSHLLWAWEVGACAFDR